jgi:hypothetical protein
MGRLDHVGESITAPGVIRRILVALLTGAVAYLITNLTSQDQTWVLLMSLFIGGVVLIAQFLVDLENRIEKVEYEQRERVATIEQSQANRAEETRQLISDGFSKINEATQLFGLVEASALRTDEVIQLVRHSTEIGPDAQPLIYRFAQAEIGRMSQFLKDLNGGTANYEGEDRDWLLGLAKHAKASIDATSLATVDSGVDNEGFWFTDLGQRYLEVQRESAVNGVTIRRVFIVDSPEAAADGKFLQLCRMHSGMQINVRVLVAGDVPPPRKSSLFDFILFDNVVSYESTVSAMVEKSKTPTIVSTQLRLRREVVEDRMERFRDLWESAKPIAELGSV